VPAGEVPTDAVAAERILVGRVANSHDLDRLILAPTPFARRWVMTLRWTLCILVALPSCQLEMNPEEDVSSTSLASTRPGYWTCNRGNWMAWTTYRSMRSPTQFECGGWCDDSSHTQPDSWVDIVGGISNECDDHSYSFAGPNSGEWNGCTLEYPGPDWQVATGYAGIDSVDQTWDRWPLTWRNGRYDDCDLGDLVTTAYVWGAFATVYDLDYCSWIDAIGTIEWGDVPVTASVLWGSTNPGSCDDQQATGNFRLLLNGGRNVACSENYLACGNVLCADLGLSGYLDCDWTPPRPCDPPGTFCNAYWNTSDPNCCSNFCYNFSCQ
jgi:hypothetical protein